MKHMNQAAKYNVLRLPDVKAMTGLSRSSIYARIADGSFPKQIRLGSDSRAVAWLQSDIEAWLKKCLADSRMED
jgi:prophage regulatory protein